MERSPLYRIPVLFALVLAAAVLAAAPAAADGGPDFIDVVAVNATSVLVTWSDDPLADSYRVFRGYTGLVGEVPGDVNQYLDTGLTPGELYIYQVASVIGGQEAWANHPDVGAMPLDAPAAITSLTWSKLTDYNNVEHLGIQLSWTPVGVATGYEIFARVGGSGDYTQWTETVESNVLAGFALPDEATRYWFKVRAYYTFYVPEYDSYMYGSGPFSPEAFIDVPAATSPQWVDIIPHFSWKPELHLATPTPWKILPVRTLHVLWPTPTPKPWNILPARSPISLLPTSTPMPIQPIEPVLPLPGRR